MEMGRILGRARPRVNQMIRSCSFLRLEYLFTVLSEVSALSTSQDLVAVLKRELKRSGITYAALAGSLGMAESSGPKTNRLVRRIPCARQARFLRIEYARLKFHPRRLPQRTA